MMLSKVGLAPGRNTTSDFTSQISDKLGCPVARGSFDEIYRCTVKCSIGEMEVAVKVFRINHASGRTMDQLTKAVLRELTVWLRLKHPNIVPLLGTARVGSPLLALVYPWMSSGTLSDYLEQATTITPSARGGLVKSIAEGLGYLHANNIVHGDLHPGNVLIDDSGSPCIADFGVAIVVEDPELQWTTTTTERIFNSRWRAPELLGIYCDQERPTFKSDIYSFGGVTFFIMSGDVPWKGKNSYQICVQLSRKATHPRPQNISDHHWNLIEGCWSLEPGDRPNVPRVLQVLAEYQQEMSASYVPLETRDTEQRYPETGVKNIVLFGQSGAGKSSVVNLIAGEEVAETSLDMVPCTMHWKEHVITFGGYTYNVFDTMGLEENKLEKKQYLDAITNAYNLIAKLQDEGGIHMLLFCVRAGRFTSPIPNNYRLFYECLCEKKVPIGLVLTGLEREPDINDCWTRFKSPFDKHGVLVDGHACITAVSGPDERHQRLYEQSRRLVRDLVIHHTRGCQEGNGYNGGNLWFMKLMGKLKEFLMRKHIPTKNNIVKVLTERCNMPKEVAVDLAKQIRQDRERSSPLDIFVR